MSSDITPAQKEFVKSVEKKVNELLTGRLNGIFQIVNHPSGFNWFIEVPPNGYYNSASLNEIDLQIANGTNNIAMFPGATFSGLYSDMLAAITYQLSKKDQDEINKEAQIASAQEISVIKAWEQNVSPVTSEQMKGAAPPTKIGYIASQVQSRWGDDPDNIPPSLNTFKVAWQNWIVLCSNSYAIMSRSSQALAQIAAARKSVKNPSADNGGMQIDASKYAIGYTGLPAQTVITSGLMDLDNKISTEISLDNFSSSESNLHIDGGASIKVPLAGIISVSIEGSAEYNLFKYMSSSSAMKMKITYPGLTLVAATPSNLSVDLKSGWYSDQILMEVVKNTGKDVTGFVIKGEFPIAEYFGIGKKFSRLKTFVVSQLPTMEFTFTGADGSKIKSDFKEQAKAKVKLLGFDIGASINQSYEVHKIDTTSQQGSVIITLAPPKILGTVPEPQSTCNVLGGVISYPPMNC